MADNGLKGPMLAALEAEEVMDEVKGGMNDSAKRRLSWPADADHGFELVAPSSSNLSQAPVTPKKLGYGKEAASAGPPRQCAPCQSSRIRSITIVNSWPKLRRTRRSVTT